MSILHVQWTIKPLFSPQPRLGCAGCGSSRPFKSSDKIRLNANGKLLDAWLIYRCTQCDSTWNRPIFERRNVRDIDLATLHALQNNDYDWVRGFAFNTGQLRRHAKQIDEFPESEIQKVVLCRMDYPSHQLNLHMKLPLETSMRADRLLASELGLSRARIQEFELHRSLSTSGMAVNLRKSVKNGMTFQLDLSNEIDALGIMSAAAGQGPHARSNSRTNSASA
jgi:hypothetical protein